MAEGARLESVYTATYRGFESPPHRHILRRARTKVRAFFSHIAHLRGDEKPRPGSTAGAASWTDRERSEWAARRASEASQSPPHRHILRRARTKVRAFFSHVAHLRGDEKPRPGFDYWRSQLDRPGAQRTGCPAGASKASQSPPHRHILRRARTKVRAFFSHIAHLRGDEKPRPGFDCWRSQLDRPRTE